MGRDSFVWYVLRWLCWISLADGLAYLQVSSKLEWLKQPLHIVLTNL